jgi:hypothetical protein
MSRVTVGSKAIHRHFHLPQGRIKPVDRRYGGLKKVTDMAWRTRMRIRYQPKTNILENIALAIHAKFLARLSELAAKPPRSTQEASLSEYSRCSRCRT